MNVVRNERWQIDVSVRRLSDMANISYPDILVLCIVIHIFIHMLK